MPEIDKPIAAEARRGSAQLPAVAVIAAAGAHRELDAGVAQGECSAAIGRLRAYRCCGQYVRRATVRQRHGNVVIASFRSSTGEAQTRRRGIHDRSRIGVEVREIAFLGGRDALSGFPVHSLITYESE